MKKRIKVFIFSIAIIFVLVALNTILLHTSNAKTLIVDTIENNLPERHWEKGTKFQFAAIYSLSWQRLSLDQKLRLDKILYRHVNIIYHSQNDIPDTMKHVVGEGKLMDYYIKGYLLTFNINITYCIATISCNDYEGLDAASGREYYAIWLLIKWFKIREFNNWIS
jgi:hypothetical protein